MSPTAEDIRQAELTFLLRDITNKLYLAATLIPDRDTAVRFNSEASAPLFRLRKRFDMPSGKVIKVGG